MENPEILALKAQAALPLLKNKMIMGGNAQNVSAIY